MALRAAILAGGKGSFKLRLKHRKIAVWLFGTLNVSLDCGLSSLLIETHFLQVVYLQLAISRCSLLSHFETLYVYFCTHNLSILYMNSGVYIVQNTMARGEGGNGAGEKKIKNEAVGNKMKKKEKGERKKMKRKRGRVVFLLI